jgi:hypothetical protein
MHNKLPSEELLCTALETRAAFAVSDSMQDTQKSHLMLLYLKVLLFPKLVWCCLPFLPAQGSSNSSSRSAAELLLITVMLRLGKAYGPELEFCLCCLILCGDLFAGNEQAGASLLFTTPSRCPGGPMCCRHAACRSTDDATGGVSVLGACAAWLLLNDVKVGRISSSAEQDRRQLLL